MNRARRWWISKTDKPEEAHDITEQLLRKSQGFPREASSEAMMEESQRQEDFSAPLHSDKSARSIPKMWNTVVSVFWGKTAIRRKFVLCSAEAPVKIERFAKFLAIRLLHGGRV